MNKALREELYQAIAGLLYMSESDEPFDIVHWQSNGLPITFERLLQLIGKKPDTPIEVLSIDEFFQPLITEQDWYGNDEKVIVQRYCHLQHLLRTYLMNVAVYRIGKIQVEIYIIGIDTNGDLVGIKTLAIET